MGRRLEAAPGLPAGFKGIRKFPSHSEPRNTSLGLNVFPEVKEPSIAVVGNSFLFIFGFSFS